MLRRSLASSERPLTLAGFGVVLLLGILTLWVPYAGDTALFATAAETLNDGGLYLRDFWDIKQPGIYWLYQIAALIPGPLWVPARVVLIVVLAGLALLVLRWTRRVMSSPSAVALAPVLVVAPFVASMKPSLLGVPESFIGPLILASLLVQERGLAGGNRSAMVMLAGGAIGGMALVFKLPYVVVLVAVSACMAWQSWRMSTLPGRHVLIRLGWFTVGAAGPAGAVTTLYLSQGELPLLLTTTFDYPRAISQLGSLYEPSLYPRLVASAVAVLGPLAGLAAIGLASRRSEHKQWAMVFMVWIASTVPVVLIQRPSDYQVLAFVVPLGLLAGLGVDAWLAQWLAHQIRSVRASIGFGVALVSALLALVFMVNPTARLGLEVVRAGRLAPEALLDVAARTQPGFADAQRMAQSAPVANPESVFVFGNPLLYVLLDRRQAIEMNGWSPEFAVPAQWVETERQLRRTTPRLVLVDDFSNRFIETSAPGIVSLLETAYVAHPEQGGVWYSRRSEVAQGPLPVTEDGVQLQRS